MKCQKCSKTAAVHLTELAKDSGGKTQLVEIHLCLPHAIEAGLVAPGSEVLPQLLNTSPVMSQKKASSPAQMEDLEPTSLAPNSPDETGLVPTRSTKSADTEACPICGLSWAQFKQGGIFGCSHDYTQFEARVLPLLKRAQEGAHQHVGKVPAKMRNRGDDRQVITLRLRRDLQLAIDAENYEQAARLRDELRQIEQN